MSIWLIPPDLDRPYGGARIGTTVCALRLSDEGPMFDLVDDENLARRVFVAIEQGEPGWQWDRSWGAAEDAAWLATCQWCHRDIDGYVPTAADAALVAPERHCEDCHTELARAAARQRRQDEREGHCDYVRDCQKHGDPW